jgi:hypothetical protein
MSGRPAAVCLWNGLRRSLTNSETKKQSQHHYFKSTPYGYSPAPSCCLGSIVLTNGANAGIADGRGQPGGCGVGGLSARFTWLSTLPWVNLSIWRGDDYWRIVRHGRNLGEYGHYTTTVTPCYQLVAV